MPTRGFVMAMNRLNLANAGITLTPNETGKIVCIAIFGLILLYGITSLYLGSRKQTN